MKSLDINDIKEILRIEIKKHIIQIDHMFERTNKFKKHDVENFLESLNLKEILESDLNNNRSNIDSKLKEIHKSLDIKFDKNSINFKKLRKKFLDLYVIRHYWIKSLLDRSRKADSDFKLHAQQKLKLGLFPELINPLEIDKKNAFARNTHLQPIIENFAEEPIQPYQVQSEKKDRKI